MLVKRLQESGGWEHSHYGYSAVRESDKTNTHSIPSPELLPVRNCSSTLTVQAKSTMVLRLRKMSHRQDAVFFFVPVSSRNWVKHVFVQTALPNPRPVSSCPAGGGVEIRIWQTLPYEIPVDRPKKLWIPTLNRHCVWPHFDIGHWRGSSRQHKEIAVKWERQGEGKKEGGEGLGLGQRLQFPVVP